MCIYTEGLKQEFLYDGFANTKLKFQFENVVVTVKSLKK